MMFPKDLECRNELMRSFSKHLKILNLVENEKSYDCFKLPVNLKNQWIFYQNFEKILNFLFKKNLDGLWSDGTLTGRIGGVVQIG